MRRKKKKIKFSSPLFFSQVIKLSTKESKIENHFIFLYSKFIDKHPDMKSGKKRRLAFLRSEKVPKGSHIHKFFMQDFNVDSWFSQKPKELKENPKNSDKVGFKPLRRRK